MKSLSVTFLLLLLLLSLILLLGLVHEVVVGDIFVAVVIVIINFTSWLGALHCCSCYLLLLSFFFFNQFSLLGLVHEGVEGVVKGVHEVGVVDWRLCACEL